MDTFLELPKACVKLSDIESFKYDFSIKNHALLNINVKNFGEVILVNLGTNDDYLARRVFSDFINWLLSQDVKFVSFREQLNKADQLEIKYQKKEGK